MGQHAPRRKTVSYLVLSRRAGEKILIGDNMVITIVELGGGQVKVGVKAPPEVPVDREEVRKRKEAEKDYRRRKKDRNRR